MDVLVTHSGQGETVDESLRSLVNQLAPSDRVVVVDADPSDKAFATIEKYYVDDKLQMEYEPGVSRGEGRQRALEIARSDIVAAHVDLDVIYHNCFSELKKFYRHLRDDNDPGILLFHGGFISDRSVLEAVGGWRDLQVHEDKDLWVRASTSVPVYYLPISVVSSHNNFEWSSTRYRLERFYLNYRDALRLGASESLLAQSISAHLTGLNRLRDEMLFRIAKKRSQPGELDILSDVGFEPGKHFLRELTFNALVQSDSLSVQRLRVPDSFSKFRTETAYPGMTSYASGKTT